MDRRHFLAVSSRFLVGSAVFGLLPWEPCAFAFVDPATVALCVNTAISVIGLFSHGGSSIEDLLHLQTEMLRQISVELNVINEWMNRISDQLTKIEQAVGAVPKNVVIELKEAKINASIADLYELQTTYWSLARGSGGIEAARKQTEKELNRNLDRVRSARQALMNPKYECSALVPIVCAAAYAETQMMIMDDESRERILPAVNAYREWLTRVSKGPTSASLLHQIASLKEQNAKYRKSSVLAPQEYDCIVKRGGTPSMIGPMYYGQYTRVRAKPVISTDMKVLGSDDLNNKVEKLIKAKLLPPEERPTRITITFENIQPAKPLDRTRTMKEWLALTTCSDEETRLRTEASQVSAMLNDAGMQLISLRMLKSAADEALTFFHKFGKGISVSD